MSIVHIVFLHRMKIIIAEKVMNYNNAAATELAPVAINIAIHGA